MFLKEKKIVFTIYLHKERVKQVKRAVSQWNKRNKESSWYKPQRSQQCQRWQLLLKCR